MKDEIRKLEAEIEAYRQAIENAEGALAAAEKELDEILAYEYGDEMDPHPPIAE